MVLREPSTGHRTHTHVPCACVTNRLCRDPDLSPERDLSSDCRAIWGYLAISYYLVLSHTICNYPNVSPTYLDHPQAVSRSPGTKKLASRAMGRRRTPQPLASSYLRAYATVRDVRVLGCGCCGKPCSTKLSELLELFGGRGGARGARPRSASVSVASSESLSASSAVLTRRRRGSRLQQPIKRGEGLRADPQAGAGPDGLQDRVRAPHA
jgi:hypothetical protein